MKIDKAYAQKRADGLGQNGGDCSARNSQAECSHQQQIQADIDQTGDYQETYGGIGIPDAAQCRGIDILYTHEGHTEENNPQISQAVFHGFRLNTHQAKERPRKGDSGCHEQQSKEQTHENGGNDTEEICRNRFSFG